VRAGSLFGRDVAGIEYVAAIQRLATAADAAGESITNDMVEAVVIDRLEAAPDDATHWSTRSRHSHLMVNVRLLIKPHRDAAFRKHC